jgi:hypothetical protein
MWYWPQDVADIFAEEVVSRELGKLFGESSTDEHEECLCPVPIGQGRSGGSGLPVQQKFVDP